MTTTRNRSAGSLFRALLSAEETRAAYHTLQLATIAVLRTAPEGSTLREVAAEQADRLGDLVREMDDDADDRREQILGAGLTPAQYDTWRAAR